MKIRTEKVIDCNDWDKVVKETYGRPYCFQQQKGGRDRGRVHITVPGHPEDFDAPTVGEWVNHETMGVSFEAWLKRDPKAPLSGEFEDNKSRYINMWWERNFYPHVSMVANDLHAKGLLEAGEYVIDIDW